MSRFLAPAPKPVKPLPSGWPTRGAPLTRGAEDSTLPIPAPDTWGPLVPVEAVWRGNLVGRRGTQGSSRRSLTRGPGFGELLLYNSECWLFCQRIIYVQSIGAAAGRHLRPGSTEPHSCCQAGRQPQAAGCVAGASQLHRRLNSRPLHRATRPRGLCKPRMLRANPVAKGARFRPNPPLLHSPPLVLGTSRTKKGKISV